MKMKKNIFIITSIALIICAHTSFAQNRVSKDILEAKVLGETFHQVDNLFSIKKNNALNDTLKTASYFNYNANIFKRLNNNAVKYVSISIQTTSGENWLLDLEKTDKKSVRVASTTTESILFNNKNKESFRGVIRGAEQKSLISLIFTQEEVKGFISITGKGVFEIGKIENSDTHILYNSIELQNILPDFSCGTNDTEEYYSSSKNKLNPVESKLTPCIGFQAVIDYSIFVDAGSSNLTTTANYIQDFYTQVFTVFYNINIDIVLNDIYIYTVEQVYTSPLNFVTTDNSYTRAGDLIQFLRNTSSPSNAGAGGLGTICNEYSYSWARLNGSFNTYPTYSLNVKIAAHEIGHNLGSNHIFICNWNSDINYQVGDNNPIGTNRITNCASNSSSCPDYAGPDPGSIMGYCSSTIDFTPQAIDVMTMRINSCPQSFTIGCTNLSLNEIPTDLQEEIIIYPNPVLEILKIKGQTNIDEILLIELTGKIIKKVVGKNEIDVSELSSGIYIIAIKFNENTIIKRVIKQ